MVCFGNKIHKFSPPFPSAKFHPPLMLLRDHPQSDGAVNLFLHSSIEGSLLAFNDGEYRFFRRGLYVLSPRSFPGASQEFHESRITSFVTQRLNWIQSRGFNGWEKAGKNAHRSAEKHR
jgi:hypothetical protein